MVASLIVLFFTGWIIALQRGIDRRITVAAKGNRMTEQQRALLIAAMTLRQNEMVRPFTDLPDHYRMDAMDIIEKAAGLKVGVDGDAAFALVGENLQAGESEFVTIVGDDHEAAKDAAVSKLVNRIVFDTLIS